MQQDKNKYDPATDNQQFSYTKKKDLVSYRPTNRQPTIQQHKNWQTQLQATNRQPTLQQHKNRQTQLRSHKRTAYNATKQKQTEPVTDPQTDSLQCSNTKQTDPVTVSPMDTTTPRCGIASLTHESRIKTRAVYNVLSNLQRQIRKREPTMSTTSLRALGGQMILFQRGVTELLTIVFLPYLEAQGTDWQSLNFLSLSLSLSLFFFYLQGDSSQLSSSKMDMSQPPEQLAISGKYRPYLMQFLPLCVLLSFVYYSFVCIGCHS